MIQGTSWNASNVCNKYMKHSFAASMIICAACSSTISSDTSGSSESFIDTLVMVASGPVVIDTTYTEILDIRSAFTEPQIESRVAYVYSTTGLDVFADPKGVKKFGHVDYGKMVALNEPLINNVPSDTMTVYGLKGHFAGISYEGKQAYIFSGYLLNLPAPTHGQTITQYFSQHLHLTKPAVRTTRECDCDGVGSKATYEFENGIVVSENGYFEGYNNSVRFNNQMTLQEVYLFSTYFYKSLTEHVPEFPIVSFTEEKDNGVTITVTAKGDYITGIVVVTGEGCYEEEGIHESADYILMSANGGC